MKKKKESYKKKISFLENAFNFLKILKPKYYLPFAGTYLLSGKLSNLNKLRGVATYDEAYDFLDKKILLNNLWALNAQANNWKLILSEGHTQILTLLLITGISKILKRDIISRRTPNYLVINYNHKIS